MTDDLDYDPALVTWLHAQLDADEEMLEGSGNLGWLTFREPNGDMRYTTAAANGQITSGSSTATNAPTTARRRWCTVRLSAWPMFGRSGS